MSRYAPEGLNNMANIVIHDLRAHGEKSYMLIMQIAVKTGLRTDEIINRIARLANS